VSNDKDDKDKDKDKNEGQHKDEPGEAARVGLCSHCQLLRRIRSPRGSTFYFCAQSKVDPDFPKYPRLPVLRCSAYRPENASGDRLG
jgi:hypothetical protein